MPEVVRLLCRSVCTAALGFALVVLPASSQEAPRNLVVIPSAEGASASQVHLRWEPVPGALGYEVLRKRNGTWWLNEDDPNCTPMTHSTSITGLSPDTEFVFCVRAVLAKGVSPSGNPVTTRTAPLGNTPVVHREVSSKPLPVVDEPASQATPPSSEKPSRAAEPEPVPLTGSITDLVPAPPPKPKATPTPAPGPNPPSTPVKVERPKGPPPPVPEGLMGLFTGTGDIRLSWRAVPEATGYLVEEERDGQWVSLEDGVIPENRPSLIVKGRSGAGPYYFRVRSVRAGVRSSFSLPTKVER